MGVWLLIHALISAAVLLNGFVIIHPWSDLILTVLVKGAQISYFYVWAFFTGMIDFNPCMDK